MSSRQVRLQLVHDAAVNFALQHNAVPLVKAVAITNDGDAPLHDLVLTLRVAPDLAPAHETRIAGIGAKATFNVHPTELRPSLERLVRLDERQRGELLAELRIGDELVAQASGGLDLLAFNEWTAGTLPEILAAFVQPNHPALTPWLTNARDALAAATGDPTLDGYATREPSRVRAFAAAVYEAARRLGITYVLPPASFETGGQKIRGPEQILGTRMGTCLDLTVAFATMLEHLGLHAVMVLLDGHAFVAVWLVDEAFAEAAVHDAVRLRKRIDLGDVLAIETTGICTSPGLDFDDAVRRARAMLADETKFLFAIDVRAARRARIQPLPARASATFTVLDPVTGAGAGAVASTMPVDELAPSFTVVEPAPIAAAPVEAPPVEATPRTRLDRWKRKLLDLSLRNRLIHFLPSKRTLPVLAPDPKQLEDLLWDERRFSMRGVPSIDAEVDPRRSADPTAAAETRRQFLLAELGDGRLYTGLSDEDLERRLLELFRAARTSKEEGGAHGLSLAVGFLRWFESPQSQQPRLAPILLVPVELERGSVTAEFKLRVADEDPRVNVTLLQKLQTEFGVDVAGLDAVPDDGKGVDVEAVFQAFRRAVKDVPRFEVVPECSIGLFSFAKFLMWRDLEARADQLRRSAVVAHMLDTPSEPFAPEDPVFPEPEALDATRPVAASFCPLSADSSQLSAIYAAADGRSFVLEGPPGTGKSQTIANLVAHALGSDKRVLFVSEKMAALGVVHRRLQAIGLGAFCLELHANKAQKREVVRQLAEALDVGRIAEPAAFAKQAAELEALRTRLNAHVEAIHRVRAAGLSVFDATGCVVALRGTPFVELRDVGIAELTSERLAQLRDAVARLATAESDVSPVASHPFRAVGREDWSPELPRRVDAAIATLAAATTRYAAALDIVVVAIGLDGTALRRADVARIDAIARHLRAAPGTPSELVTAPGMDVRISRWRTIAATGRRAATGTAKLALHWNDAFLRADHATLRSALARHRTTFAPIRWFVLRSTNGTLRALAKGPLRPIDDVIDDLELAVSVAADRGVVTAASNDAQRCFGSLWRDVATDFDALEHALQWAGALHEYSVAVAGTQLELGARLRARWAELCAEPALTAPGGALRVKLDDVIAAGEVFRTARADLSTLLTLDEAVAFDGPLPFLESVRTTLGLWNGRTTMLAAFCAWLRERRAAEALGLAPLVERLVAGEISRPQLLDVAERSVLQAWLEAQIGADPALRHFRGAQHERAIHEFRRLDDEVARLSAEVVRARLSARVPSASSGATVGTSEVGLLLREAKKQRGHLAPRQLVARLPNLLPRLKPCLLMSPLSVAQVLDPSFPPFDLVVFDEASQIPVWDAIGALGRGAQAVVVGDSRQLPPTSFFQKVDGDDDDDEPEVEDLESILDECGAAGLPRRYLKWHYRSRHESLITFSNHHYYDGKLLTFPSPDAVRDGRGVRLVAITDGVYDRGKSHTNAAEARALVAEVVRRLVDPTQQKRSIGVVTFSMPQQVLIEDLLDRARREHPEIERHFTSVDERLFVKNLENVQGDERDVMLFSICYGPDAAGKVRMNFGPLNRQGGERRLNVAITRAREELVVFSSLRPEHIDLSRTNATGVRDLKTFLDYAARGAVAIAEKVSVDVAAEFGSPFEAEVSAAMEAQRLVVHRQVGCSGYRIDLAVVDPDAPGRYLLGVECDGATYHSAATARDRDRLRALVLHGLGWQLHRIWSTDWWFDRDREIARLREAVEAAKRGRPPVVAVPVVPVVEVPPPPPPSEPTTDASAASADSPDGPTQIASKATVAVSGDPVRAIVDAAAPLTLKDLARRLAVAVDRKSVTERFLDEVRAMVAKARVFVDADDVVWAKGQDAATWREVRADASREFDDVPVVELCNAARRVLEANLALPREDLARETARAFGVTRLGRVVRERAEIAIERLIAGGEAVVDGESVRAV